VEAPNTHVVDQGIERFIPKSSDDPVAYTVAVESGFHREHTCAILFGRANAVCYLEADRE
jgi:hypothetical protein